MGDKLRNFLKKTVKRVAKRILRILAVPLIIVIIVIILLASCVYFITVDDGTYKEGDWSSPPYAAAVYKSNASVTADGEITASKTSNELWDEMLKNNSRVDEYLSGPEALAKLMNAELVTQFPDMRETPDEDINWEDINLAEGDLQGIVKFKRYDKDGNVKTLTATDEDTFYTWIEKYCETGDETVKQKALSHFILKQQGEGSTVRGSGDGDYIVKTDEPDASPTVSKTDLKKALKQWTSGKMQENALSILDKVMEIEEKYKINALFTYALLRQESGIGIADSSWVRENNWTSLTALGHVQYESPQANLEEFVKKTICGNYYFKVGKVSVQQIGDKYCADPAPPEWANGVVAYMSEIYQLCGVEANYTDESTEHTANDTYTDISDRIIKAAQRTPSPGSGLCQKWVRQVYSNAGLGNKSFATAYQAYKSNCVSKSKDNIPVGAAVYGTGKNSGGAGHVGIYIGDGKVMDNIGRINKSTLEEWISWQTDSIEGNKGWLGWGWQSGAPSGTVTINEGNEDNDVSESTGKVKDGEIKTKAKQYYIEVATWSQTDTTITTDDPREEGLETHEYIMTTTSVNYQEMIEKYTMPFNLLWALLVTGESENFVLELADLVYNSKIEVSICDNYTKNTDVDKKTYTKEDKNKVKVKVTETTQNITASDEFEDIKTTDYTTTKTVINQTNTLAIALTKADVWIVDYEVEYKQGAKNTSTTTDKTTEDDQEFPNQPTSQSDTYQHQRITDLINKVIQKANQDNQSTSEVRATQRITTTLPDQFIASVNTVTKDIEVKTYTRNKDIEHNLTNTVETIEYIKEPATLKEKVNKDSNTPNFITIFNKSEYSRNKSNIKSVSSWLFEILEINEDTKNMVDIIKYFLYKATNTSYGVTEFDFSVYNLENFTSVTDIQGGNVEEKVWYALRNAGFSEYATAGLMGNIYGESGFNPTGIEGGYNENNGGIGLCQWTNSGRGSKGRNTNLKRYAQSKGSEWKNEDIQIQFLITEVTGKGEAKGYASKAFISNSLYGRYYTENDWKNANSVEDATRAFCATFERPGAAYFNSSMQKRVNAAKGYYDKYKGKDLSEFSGVTSETAQKVLKAAEGKLGCAYVWGATGPNTFDCSGFTQWCYRQVGITIPRTSSAQHNKAKEVLDVSKAEPGDVLWKSGHVGICVSNQNGVIKYIHAPQTGDVVKYSTYKQFTKALRFSK